MLKENVIQVRVKCKKEIAREEILRVQHQLITSALSLDENYADIHDNLGERILYSWSNIYMEGSKLRKGEVCKFKIKVNSDNWYAKLIGYLTTLEKLGKNKTNLSILEVDSKVIFNKGVSKVEIVTPLLLPKEYGSNSNLLPSENFLDILDRLNKTTIHKYNKIFNTNLDIEMNVFEGLTVNREIAISMVKHAKKNEKQGNKYMKTKGFTGELEINLSDDAQKVIEYALNSGLGKSCSYLGAGFLKVKETENV